MSNISNSLTIQALQKFKKNFWGVFSFWIIIIIGLISVFAYVIAPDSSQNANQMHLTIHSKKPGFKVKMLTIPSTIENNQSVFSKLFYGYKNTETEIPITDFEIENNTLFYTEYASDGLIGMQKTINLNN